MEKDWTFIINTDKDLVIAAKRPTLKDWNGPEANLEAVKLYCLDSYKKENPFDPKLSVFEGDLDFFMKYQREIDNFEYLDKMLRKKIDYKQETKPGVVGFKDMPKVMYNKFKDEYLGKYMPLEIKYRINVPEIFCDYLANKNEPDNASVKNILPAIEERIKDVFKTTSHVENEKTIIEEDKTIFEITMTHDFACTDKTDSLNFPYGTIEDKLQRPLGIALNNLIPANVKSKNPTEMITFDSITPVPDHTRMENDLKLRLNNELKKGLNLPHQVLTDVILSIPAKNAKIVNEILKKKGLLQKEAIDRYFNSDDITKLKKKSSGRNIGR